MLIRSHHHFQTSCPIGSIRRVSGSKPSLPTLPTWEPRKIAFRGAPVTRWLSRGHGSISILAPLEDIAVLHWHGEVCEPPPGTESLAHTPACVNQAFIPGPACLALQFHIEGGADGIEPWLVGYTGEISATSGVTVAGLRADRVRLGPALRQSAEAVMHPWLSEVSLAS